ncbi:MAG: hypothetical protein EOS12_22070 [Mesorhizobium sp.]|nr:MAG: hypothetical protein EOS12_22070 [Mesorhizobium sp.]
MKLSQIELLFKGKVGWPPLLSSEMQRGVKAASEAHRGETSIAVLEALGRHGAGLPLGREGSQLCAGSEARQGWLTNALKLDAEILNNPSGLTFP